MDWTKTAYFFEISRFSLKRLIEKASSKKFIQYLSTKEELVIWSEAEPSQREFFLSIILEKESINISSPFIIILKKEKD